jgi:hypothetical protein
MRGPLLLVRELSVGEALSKSRLNLDAYSTRRL